MANDFIKPASRWRTNLIGLYMAVMAILLAYLVFVLFPERITDAAGNIAWSTTLKILMSECAIQPEARLLLLIMAMGALGSYVHACTSFVSYVGNRSLVSSWTWWYLLRPFIGMALAVIFYFVTRGGLLSAGAAAGDISPYGFAAAAGLVGMFSKQATDKLEEVFNNLFQVNKDTGDYQRADKLGINRPVTETMIPRDKISAFKLTLPEDETLLLTVMGVSGPGITRIPILGDDDHLRYLVHRSLLNEFTANWAGEEPATLADLAADPASYTLIHDAIAFVPQTASVAETKAAMDSTDKCQDVVITAQGKRDEPVTGWMTNIDISRLASI